MVGRSEYRAGRAGVRRAEAAGVDLVARVIQFVASIVVLVIIAGILLVVLKANPSNGVVSGVHSWGIAVVVYLAVGGLIARLLGRRYRGRRTTRSSHSENKEIAWQTRT
jgi:protein-S-isoprenylcysteine O-methyltransferase Ste14